MAVGRFRQLRWWVMGLLMLGSIVNYLTRSTLAVAAPKVLADLQISKQQYLWILGAFQGTIMLQPICGYVLDVLGLKVGFAIFATAWSFISMAHGLAHNWQTFAWLRGLLGFAEGSANPAGMKATSEWFPARERGLAGGFFNIGASVGLMLAPPLVAWAILVYNWQAAFVMTGLMGLVWVVLWLWLYDSPDKHRRLSAEERHAIVSGQEAHLRGDGARPSIASILTQRNFWGIALPRFLADPTWGTLTFWLPLYLSEVRHFDLKQIALFAWVPFLAADLGCFFGGAISLALQRHFGVGLINARRGAFTVGACMMMGVGFVGFVENPYAAIALLSLAGFAHQTLSVTVITMSSDLFRRSEVATVAGMAGTCGNAGLLIFSLMIGALVTTVGYTPFFVGLGVLDLVGAVLLWTLVRERTGPAFGGGLSRRLLTMPPLIQNPILRGFNPDPSIVRVGDDYYIATSTFEWFPGVQIHHSRDLVHWRLLTRPLTRASQLNMLGDPDSCGIWAPCLTYADGLFHLIYTDVKRYGRVGAPFRDFHNYLVTSPRIDGEWSDPVFLNSSGFDPSLFHDDDGRKYLVNMIWDHRPGQNRFGGIVLQEYSPAARALVGDRRWIFSGTPIGFTEGPHLYRRGAYYYLIVAEGGTGWGHAVTMARSRSIGGPYEVHPDTHILTARNRPDVRLQRAGHADLVETENGQTYMVFLCGRPLRNRGRCTLGRETAIQKMRWDEDGWLRVADGSGVPSLTVEAPALPPQPGVPEPAAREEFDGPTLPIDFQWLRSPWPDELFSLTARPGHLRLFGRETIGSLFRQSLVARRQQAHCYSASTVMTFEPEHYQQMAGLVCYYNSAKFHYFYASHDEALGKHLRVLSALPDTVVTDVFSPPIPIPAHTPVELRAEVDEERLRFAYRMGNAAWAWLPQVFDASALSDEATAPGAPNFTGAFVGMSCQDLAGTARPADFDWFEYREREYVEDPTLA